MKETLGQMLLLAAIVLGHLLFTTAKTLNTITK